MRHIVTSVHVVRLAATNAISDLLSTGMNGTITFGKMQHMMDKD
jgi:hypothetical protein